MAFDNNPNNNDYDGLPGSSESSAAFDRLYNRDGYSEFTNLPDIDDRQEAFYAQQVQDAATQELTQRELAEAMTRVQYWPHAGRFIIPRQNTYAAHLELVREGNQVDIQFDKGTYLYFDKIIADRANKPAIFDPSHPDYPEYETLRENLAVLRNDIMGIYMEDGSFDPGDEKYLPRLVQIAAELGDALNADNRMRNVVYPSLDTQVANIEGEGAAYMYEYITERQLDKGFLQNTWSKVRSFLGQPSNQWDLPPIDQTAFSQQALLMPPPEDELCGCTPHEMRIRSAKQAEELRMQIDPKDTSAIADVNGQDRAQALKHGRIIIEWLKNIQFTDKTLEDLSVGFDANTDGEQRQAMALAAQSFDQVMASAQAHGANLLANEKIIAAGHARDVVGHTLEIMAKLESPDGKNESMNISNVSDGAPEAWNALSKESLKRLMKMLTEGMEEALSELDLQHADFQQEREELAEQHVGDALAYQEAHMARRSGKGFDKQEKIRRELAADDRAAKQNRFDDGDTDEAIRIGKQKLARDQTQNIGKQKAGGTKTGKAKGEQLDDKPEHDESMAGQIAEHDALGKSSPLAGSAIPGKMNNNDLVKQLGKQLMAMQQQANVAASEVADVKGGGVGLDESAQDRLKHNPRANKQIS